jgi:hypothetical protein
VAWLDSESAILAGTADGRILTFDAATLALRDALAISAEPIDVLVVAPGSVEHEAPASRARPAMPKLECLHQRE